MRSIINAFFNENTAISVLFSGAGVTGLVIIFTKIFSKKKKKEEVINKYETSGNGNIISPQVSGIGNIIIGSQYNNLNSEHVVKGTVEELLKQCPQLSETKLTDEFKSSIQFLWSELLFHSNSVAQEKCLSCKCYGEVNDISDLIEVIKELDAMGYRKFEFSDMELINKLYSIKSQIDENRLSSMSIETQDQYILDFSHIVSSIPSYANQLGI